MLTVWRMIWPKNNFKIENVCGDCGMFIVALQPGVNRKGNLECDQIKSKIRKLNKQCFNLKKSAHNIYNKLK